MYNCSLCLYETRYISFIFRHYSQEHENKPNFVLSCGINGCTNRYNVVTSYKKHYYRKHRDKKDNFVPDENEQELMLNSEEVEPVCEFGDSVSVHNDIQGEEEAQESDKSLNEIITFLLKLREKHLVTAKAAVEIIEKFEDIISRCLEDTQGLLDELLPEHFESDTNPDKLLRPLLSLHKSLSACNSTYKQNLLFKKNGFTEPRDILLGGEDRAVYIPIKETLSSLLSKEDVRAYIHNAESDQKTVNSFLSGSYAKNNNFFKMKNALQIELYVDDYQIVNPLGNKTKKHKICAFYFSIGNIPVKFRSRLYTLQLLLLTKSRNVRKYGMASVLRSFVEDMKSLETEGISLTINNMTYHYFATISVVVADNLAAHQIGGYNESFSGLRICRFCNATKEGIKSEFKESKFELRTIQTYNETVKMVAENPQLSTAYGLKSSSVLNELSNFHICWGSPSDIAHDIFEGFAIDLLQSLIQYCIQMKFFTLQALNESIKDFPYCKTCDKNKPANLNVVNREISIKQTCAEMHLLLRIFPLLVGHFVPEEDENWRNFIDFLEVLDFILAPSLNNGEINHMTDMISNFLEDFFALYPDLSRKPKSHFLIHYGTQYKYFGPLINYCTLRYESKHSYMKSTMKMTKNYRNPCKTMAMKHQYLQCLHHMTEDYLHSSIDFSNNAEMIRYDDLEIEIQFALCEKFGILESIRNVKHATYEGISYSTGIAIISAHDRDWEIGCLKYIIHINCEIYFVLQKLTTSYSRHLHCYVTSKSSIYLVKHIKNLLSPFPLPLYTASENKHFLIFRHYIQN